MKSGWEEGPQLKAACHTDIRWYEISINQGGSQVWQISWPKPHPVSRDCPCQISRKMLWWSASTTHASILYENLLYEQEPKYIFNWLLLFSYFCIIYQVFAFLYFFAKYVYFCILLPSICISVFFCHVLDSDRSSINKYPHIGSSSSISRNPSL